jgi:hypothetical protein
MPGLNKKMVMLFNSITIFSVCGGRATKVEIVGGGSGGMEQCYFLTI